MACGTVRDVVFPLVAVEAACQPTPGANLGAIRANNFSRQANEYGQTNGDHASSRTDPDDAERLTGIYGSALGTAGAAPYRREKWPRYRS